MKNINFNNNFKKLKNKFKIKNTLKILKIMKKHNNFIVKFLKINFSKIFN